MFNYVNCLLFLKDLNLFKLLNSFYVDCRIVAWNFVILKHKRYFVSYLIAKCCNKVNKQFVTKCEYYLFFKLILRNVMTVYIP
jgi:hypothetical protein